MVQDNKRDVLYGSDTGEVVQEVIYGVIEHNGNMDLLRERRV